MEHLPEYLSHHLYLVTATVIVAVIALVFEFRGRALGGGINTNMTVALHNKGALILDIRPLEEFATGHIVDARHIALDQLADNIDSIKKYREKPVVVCCETGVRSAQAVKLLKSQGFTQVMNLQGGLAAWRTDNLPLTGKKS